MSRARVAALHRELARIHAELAKEIDEEDAAVVDALPAEGAPAAEPRPISDVERQKARRALRQDVRGKLVRLGVVGGRGG